MTKVILYIAASLDGFVAIEDGDVSWLDDFHGDNGNYGFSEFFSGDQCNHHGFSHVRTGIGFREWPYQGIPTFVFIKRALRSTERANITWYSGSPQEIPAIVRQKGEEHIWLVGGALLARSFMKQNLVDEIILSIVPFILGSGISLFGRMWEEIRLELKNSLRYGTGIVQLRYRVA
jgi:dihydrofolate reductase